MPQGRCGKEVGAFFTAKPIHRNPPPRRSGQSFSKLPIDAIFVISYSGDRLVGARVTRRAGLSWGEFLNLPCATRLVLTQRFSRVCSTGWNRRGRDVTTSLTRGGVIRRSFPAGAKEELAKQIGSRPLLDRLFGQAAFRATQKSRGTIHRFDSGRNADGGLGLKKRGQFGDHEHLIRRNHGDDVPRTDLSTQFAPDAHGEINSADAHGVTGMSRVRYFVDAIHRTHRDAGVTARAQVLVEDRQLLGEFLLSHFRYACCSFSG